MDVLVAKMAPAMCICGELMGLWTGSIAALSLNRPNEIREWTVQGQLVFPVVLRSLFAIDH